MRKNKPSDEMRLLHIRDAAELVLDFTQGIDFHQFTNDIKTYSATIKQIEIVGEAVCNLTNDFKNMHPHIEWDKIEKTRHVLIHEYYDLSDIIIWRIITIHIPQLLKDIEPLIK